MIVIIRYNCAQMQIFSIQCLQDHQIMRVQYGNRLNIL